MKLTVNNLLYLQSLHVSPDIKTQPICLLVVLTMKTKNVKFSRTILHLTVCAHIIIIFIYKEGTFFFTVLPLPKREKQWMLKV